MDIDRNLSELLNIEHGDILVDEYITIDSSIIIDSSMPITESVLINLEEDLDELMARTSQLMAKQHLSELEVDRIIESDSFDHDTYKHICTKAV